MRKTNLILALTLGMFIATSANAVLNDEYQDDAQARIAAVQTLGLNGVITDLHTSIYKESKHTVKNEDGVDVEVSEQAFKDGQPVTVSDLGASQQSLFVDPESGETFVILGKNSRGLWSTSLGSGKREQTQPTPLAVLQDEMSEESYHQIDMSTLNYECLNSDKPFVAGGMKVVDGKAWGGSWGANVGYAMVYSASKETLAAWTTVMAMNAKLHGPLGGLFFGYDPAKINELNDEAKAAKVEELSQKATEILAAFDAQKEATGFIDMAPEVRLALESLKGKTTPDLLGSKNGAAFANGGNERISKYSQFNDFRLVSFADFKAEYEKDKKAFFGAEQAARDASIKLFDGYLAKKKA